MATGALSPGEIASALRGVLERHRNATVVMGEVTSLDLDARRVVVSQAGERHTGADLRHAEQATVTGDRAKQVEVHEARVGAHGERAPVSGPSSTREVARIG